MKKKKYKSDIKITLLN